ncbi:unnamed protein product [Closterium sp. NIES-53]
MALHFINRNRVSNLVEYFLREQQENHTARDPSLKSYRCSFQSASASKKRRLVDSDERFASACGRRQVEEEEHLQSESNITHTSQQSFPSDSGYGATSVTHSDEAELANLEEELLCRGASDLLLLRMASAPPEMEVHGIDEKHLDLNAEPTSPSDSPPATLAQSSDDGSVQLPGLTNGTTTESDQFVPGSGAAETSHKRKRTAQQQTKTCLKCGKKFATGQALGGHMRKHWNGSIRVQTKQLLAEVGPSRTSSPAHSGSHSHESDLASPEPDGKQRRANEAESTARPLVVADIDLNLKI